jgi:hypothetical protein
MKPDLNKVFAVDSSLTPATDKQVLAQHASTTERPAETATTLIELSRQILLCIWQC